jgi:hypothetical protein
MLNNKFAFSPLELHRANILVWLLMILCQCLQKDTLTRMDGIVSNFYILLYEVQWISFSQFLPFCMHYIIIYSIRCTLMIIYLAPDAYEFEYVVKLGESLNFFEFWLRKLSWKLFYLPAVLSLWTSINLFHLLLLESYVRDYLDAYQVVYLFTNFWVV